MAIPVCNKTAVLFALLVTMFVHVKAQIGFGTTTPHASAIVHIQDTAKGLLIPRMTAMQKNNIHNPAEGLLVYQTDNDRGFWYYTGAQWMCLANNYKQTLILTGDITDSEAAAKIATEVGPITQEIRIYDCTALTTVDLSMLKGIAEVTINNNPLLQSVNVTNLVTVDAGFNVYNCPALTNLNLSLLQTVGNNLRFSNTGFTSLNFPVLKKATTAITIDGNPNLLSVAFPQLTGPVSRVLPSFSITENPRLVSIDAPLLGKAESVYMTGNQKCTSVNLASLSTVRTLELRRDSALAAVSFPSLASVSNQLTIQADSSLVTLSLPVLATAEGILIKDIKSTTISFPALTRINNLLNISNNNSLTGISLPVLTYANNLIIGNNSVFTSLGIPLLATLGKIYFSANPSCTSLSFPALTTITGQDMSISSCRSLASISFPNLSITNNSNFDFEYNNLPSSAVNALLNKFATMVPAITGKDFYFNYQTPPAPPTGQGITDRLTLLAANNNVYTDQ